MIKDITVYLDGSAGDQARIDYAVALCTRFDAHLTGLFLNPMPQMILTGAEVALPMEISRELEEKAIVAGDANGKKLAEKLSNAVNLSELRRHDVFSDQIAGIVASQARATDLIVMSRPYGDDTDQADPIVLEAALFGAGGGTLVVPPNASAMVDFKRILVGWQNTREAARAVAEAMPFIRDADQVVLAMVDEEGSPAELGLEPAADIARHLDRHGAKVEVRHLSKWDSSADALMNEAKAIDADLMVVGGYGHSRFREWMLGGTTRDLLEDANLPLLMAH